MRRSRVSLVVAVMATVTAGAVAFGATAVATVAIAAQGPLAAQAQGPLAATADDSLEAAVIPAGLRQDGPDLDLDRAPVAGPLLPPSKPVAITIPAIGVRSPLHPLGMTAARTLQVPSGSRYDEAAWYKHSATPGARGPAVILGHVDSPADGPSIFYRLDELRPGDTVRVTRADGVVAVFTVDTVRRYPKDRFPTRLVYGDTPHAALRLITCGGTFDRDTGHYVDNVVVFASLTSTQPPSGVA